MAVMSVFGLGSFRRIQPDVKRELSSLKTNNLPEHFRILSPVVPLFKKRRGRFFLCLREQKRGGGGVVLHPDAVLPPRGPFSSRAMSTRLLRRPPETAPARAESAGRRSAASPEGRRGSERSERWAEVGSHGLTPPPPLASLLDPGLRPRASGSFPSLPSCRTDRSGIFCIIMPLVHPAALMCKCFRCSEIVVSER